jgi:2'-5' RNA ligase
VPDRSWEVEEAQLVSSRPGPGGSRYEVLERLPLT